MLDAMAMDPAILGFVPHTESLDGVGYVPVYVHDLATRWIFEQERNRDFITSAHAAHESSLETSAPPPFVWSFLTDPTKRILWQKHVTGVLPQTEGRIGAGSINHCMHGAEMTMQHVADWRPFSYITTRYEEEGFVGSRRLGFTYQLEEIESGTRLTIRIESPGDEQWGLIGDGLIVNTVENSKHLLDHLEKAARLQD